MKLYKNVDVKDLNSILEKGILSLNESGNNNWQDGRRGNNSCDEVYLFKPIGKVNSFPNYGLALIECEVADARVNEMSEADIHRNDYIEYVTDKVSPDQITAVYVPEAFKDRLGEISKVTWCGFTPRNYDGTDMAEETVRRFVETAELDSCECNYFRGWTEERTPIDVYHITYVL